MPWVKLSDTFAEDPCFDRGGAPAIGLHVAALCYCSRHLTDGAISASAVRRLTDLDDPILVAKQLVESGVWAETADGFELVDYLVDQPSRAQTLAVRKKRAEAGRAGGRASGESRRSKPEADSKQVASSGLEPPTRTRPDPSTTSARDTVDVAATELMAVVVDKLPDRVIPDRARLVESCSRLSRDGWTPDELRSWADRQRFPADAGPGLAVHRLDDLRPEDRRRPTKARRAPTGPVCENGVRIAADGSCCAEHAAGERQ